MAFLFDDDSVLGTMETIKRVNTGSMDPLLGLGLFMGGSNKSKKKEKEVKKVKNAYEYVRTKRIKKTKNKEKSKEETKAPSLKKKQITDRI